MQGLIRTRTSRASGALLVALACLCVALLLRGGEVAHGASAKPNVIMFTTDDQTLRDMIAMPRTTNLIGGQGTNFQRAFVSFPLCCPSRISVQTGQYAHNHHVLGNTPPSGGYQVFNDTNDLPIWLQTAGYRTIHIGKMPNGFPAPKDPNYVPPGWGPFLGDANPLSKGEFYGFLGPGSTYFGFQLNENGIVKQYDSDDYQTDIYADIAVDRIDNHAANFPNTPLYMQVQFFAPHDPNQPATRHAGCLLHRAPPGRQELQREGPQGQARLGEADQPPGRRPDLEDHRPLPRAARDPAGRRRGDRADRRQARGRRASSETPT